MASHDERLIEHAMAVLLAMVEGVAVPPSAEKLACRVMARYVGASAMALFYGEYKEPRTPWAGSHLRMRLEAIETTARRRLNSQGDAAGRGCHPKRHV